MDKVLIDEFEGECGLEGDGEEGIRVEVEED